MSKYIRSKTFPKLTKAIQNGSLFNVLRASQSSNPWIECECRGCAKAEFHKNADWRETNERSFIFVGQIVARFERRWVMATSSADPRDRVKRTDL
jgi:hypothetical protein